MRRVLVLGGGGHLGSALSHALTCRGARVTVATLKDGARANLDGLRVDRVQGDDNQAGTIEQWVPGHDLVIDCAAPYALDLHEPGKSHVARLTAAEDRMGRLLTAAQSNNAVLVHIGSILTLTSGGAVRRMIESSHPYFRMKRRMQDLAIGAARSGQPVVVVNPASLLGPWNLRPFHHCYVSAVLTGGMPASFPETINVMDVRDAAETILRVTDAGWFGRPVPIVGHDVTVHDLTDKISRLGGVRRPPRWRALTAGAAILYAAETAMGVAGLRSPYPTLPVLLTLASGAVKIGQLQRALGPEIRPLEATLVDEISWHRSRGCP